MQIKKTSNLFQLKPLEFCVLGASLKRLVIWQAVYKYRIDKKNCGLVFAPDKIDAHHDRIYVTGKRQPYIVRDEMLLPVRLFNLAGSRSGSNPSVDDPAGYERVRPFNAVWFEAHLEIVECRREFDDFQFTTLPEIDALTVAEMASKYELVRAANFAPEWRTVTHQKSHA